MWMEAFLEVLPPQQIILVLFLVSSCHYSDIPVSVHFMCTGNKPCSILCLLSRADAKLLLL